MSDRTTSTPAERVAAIRHFYAELAGPDHYTRKDLLSILTWAIRAAKEDGEHEIGTAWLGHDDEVNDE